jgi:hypothetical protein
MVITEHDYYMEISMNNIGKFVVKMGLLSALSVMPLAAQVDNGVVFTAPFPFYAGNVEFPAGTYIATQPDTNIKVLELRNIARRNGLFVNYIPTSSLLPYRETDVTFDKHGDTGYLRTLSVAGETDGIELVRSKAEAKATTVAENATIVEHATLTRGE